MSTPYEQMKSGEIYWPSDTSLMEQQFDCLEKLYDFNATRPHEQGKRQALLKEMLAEVGEEIAQTGTTGSGPVAGGLIGFIGHALIDLSWGGIPWWSWVITSAFVGVVVGLFTKKLHVEEGDFNKKKVGVFALANVIANLIGWIVVAPVLDILIYAEPAKKVFAQGVFAGISNSVTAVVVGGLLVLAYTKTIAKKGSLDKE